MLSCVARIKQLAASGYELRRPAADYKRDGIYELRAKHIHVQYRILYFFHGQNVAILAHAITKEEAAVPPIDIERGATRFCEVVKLGGLGRLGKRKKLSVIIPTKVLKNTDFFSFLPQLPQLPQQRLLISRRSHFFALLPIERAIARKLLFEESPEVHTYAEEQEDG